MARMPKRFVSEPLEPVIDTCDTSGMTAGEPGLPSEFVWRGRTLRISGVVRRWRETGKCDHGSADRYVRKHWFEVATDYGDRMTIYFERQPRRGRKGPRWWLFSIHNEEREQAAF
jgi:hypothetical protein